MQLYSFSDVSALLDKKCLTYLVDGDAESALQSMR